MEDGRASGLPGGDARRGFGRAELRPVRGSNNGRDPRGAARLAPVARRNAQRRVDGRSRRESGRRDRANGRARRRRAPVRPRPLLESPRSATTGPPSLRGKAAEARPRIAIDHWLRARSESNRDLEPNPDLSRLLIGDSPHVSRVPEPFSVRGRTKSKWLTG